MNNELFEALTMLEKEKNISKDTLLDAIKQSLLQACKNHYGKTEANNVVVNIDPDTCEFEVYAEKTVVEKVEDELTEISLTNAKLKDSRYELGDIVRVDIKSKEFGRIATQNAKNVILQKIREEERKVLYNEYYEKEKDIVTGVVQRYVGRNISVNLGKVDAMLNAEEMIKGETYRPTERIKVYVLEVKDTPKGPKILVSRTHPELVKRLFEAEVTEVKDGTVEIKSIAREAGSRTKMAVWSNNPDVDPVGACVGLNGARVNAVVDELHGEKIDIINWDENPALLIENALSPAKVISVIADGDEKTAKVVVPDYQLSLAIGKEGQNARLAARLTGFKIDIKSETQARESGDLLEYEGDYYEDEYYDDGEYDGEEYYDDQPFDDLTYEQEEPYESEESYEADDAQEDGQE
ncbi:MAG: transcription termination factor NusA [Lachnospiraceae bacterium]|nr:transcription termination factor NusA [Lachnospiraceae bacterium]MDD7078360.1 transcription termination factor NusA [Lachnospiraceae bacterium]MDY3729526.1 transcription termination factor NusA [Candidatus Choladocola sp.]